MAKKFKHGLILGKFMPLHNGHMYLVTNGIQQCENLTILVCTLEREPIPGYLRHKWMKHYCDNHPIKGDTNINVVHINYDLPQEPSEHPQFWKIWTDIVLKHCPNIEVFLSSEDYGFEMAKHLNIEHVLVDKERVKAPISGTEIRNNPYKNWEFIYREARTYFLNRVYMLGPESTGKTEMCKRLSEHFEANWVPEYGRTLWERESGNIHYMDFFEIVIMQRNIESRMAANSIGKQIMFCDTEVVTTKVFGDLMFPNYSEVLNPFFDYHINQQIKDNTGHYFIMSPEGVEPVQDGTRNYLDPEPRKKHFDLIVFELRRRNIPFTILTGSYEQRFNQLCIYVEAMLTHKLIIDVDSTKSRV